MEREFFRFSGELFSHLLWLITVIPIIIFTFEHTVHPHISQIFSAQKSVAKYDDLLRNVKICSNLDQIQPFSSFNPLVTGRILFSVKINPSKGSFMLDKWILMIEPQLLSSKNTVLRNMRIHCKRKMTFWKIGKNEKLENN